MKAVKLTVRTPGMFLDRESTGFDGNMYIQFQKEEGMSWKFPEELGNVIRAYEGTPDLTILAATCSLEIPTRDQDEKTYTVVFTEDGTWNYRIVATRCPDCKRIFNDTQRTSSILSNFIDPNGDEVEAVVVGNGSAQC